MVVWNKFIGGGGAPLLLAGAATLSTVWLLKEDISLPLPRTTLRGDDDARPRTAHIPPSLDADTQRRLANSLNLGGGACQWQPPTYEVPGNIDFHKTIVAGFPSGDKRMVYVQMEALTGWPAKDEWDFAFQGMSNHPFIKANYPHHEGYWGWGGVADQVVLMVPNIRRSMVEYHDIVWDLGYATTWEQATSLRDNLFVSKPHLDDYFDWRDSRALDEARWYGWFIDYWMEGGLLRDIFTHKLTTKEHWDDLMVKPFYTRAELEYSNYVLNETLVPETYDPHCTSGEISNGCEPVAVLSADWLRDHTKGPAETAAIANVLLNDAKTGQYVIEHEAWDCIWDEMIITRKGPKQVYDRPGVNEYGYNFSPEMLEEMLDELDRLIAKYGGPDWVASATAARLVQILVEHRGLIQMELNDVNSGVRRLTDRDFLGPRARAALRREAGGGAGADDGDGADDGSGPGDGGPAPAEPRTNEHAKYFIALEQKRLEDKRRSAVAGAGVDGTTTSGGTPPENKRSHEDYVRYYIEATKALAQIHSMELGPDLPSKPDAA